MVLPPSRVGAEGDARTIKCTTPWCVDVPDNRPMDALPSIMARCTHCTIVMQWILCLTSCREHDLLPRTARHSQGHCSAQESMYLSAQGQSASQPPDVISAIKAEPDLLQNECNLLCLRHGTIGLLHMAANTFQHQQFMLKQSFTCCLQCRRLSWYTPER